ncbi:MAG: tetratricopeptide repeat protein [Glaciimonas sp.]|nr:tetratricopeptide repeat protein [Glaciimonas sp.]
MHANRTQAEVLFFEGNRRMEAKDAEGAEASFKQALSLAPNFSEAMANLGWLREQAGAIAEAETYYRQAIALSPENVQIHLNLGVLLMNRKCFGEAEAINRQILQYAPDSPAAWSNLGVLLACLKREDEAEHCYRTALALDSSYSKARFNLSYILLRQGRLEEGWRCLEARVWYERFTTYFTCPRWCGEALTGKSVVVGFEAGHGDMIQFCRYASVLKTRGATHITLVCHPGLKALFSTLSGVDAVFSFKEDVPASGWDFWTLPMSLPHYCHTRLDSIPAPIPYLSADPVRVAKWSALLPTSGFRVGLAWKGNPLFENDGDRSLPSLDTLAPLGAVAGIRFFSLQKGPGEDEAQRPPAGLSILNLGGDLQDFADTAAVVASLDLVISVDTAVAHLAGSLGKPCWVLLPDYRTDWRWLTERTDSPWYPARMRLFRQPSGGGWSPVVVAVVKALERWKKGRESHPSGVMAKRNYIG